MLQALGHFLLGHQVPRDFADFLRQRVEANYFAAAVLMPETAAAPVLDRAKQDRDLAVEDLVDLFSVSYEMAAHRFTNLATHHLDLPCHFVKNDASGIIYKAYENDGVVFPADPSGAIEGQRLCRQWSGRQVFGAADRFSPYCQYSDTPSGTYFCVAQVDPRADRGFAITLGVPFEHSRWFRGREATTRTRSACPDGECCSRPPVALAERWEGQAWPSARAHSHILSALPAGSFPGVDDADIYEFLDQHAREERDSTAASGRCGPRRRSGGSSARSRPGWPRPAPSARRPGARATSASCWSARSCFDRLNKPMIPSFRSPVGRPLAARGLLPAWRASMSPWGRERTRVSRELDPVG